MGCRCGLGHGGPIIPFGLLGCPEESHIVGLRAEVSNFYGDPMSDSALEVAAEWLDGGILRRCGRLEVPPSLFKANQFH
jgi:hypothetical protein